MICEIRKHHAGMALASQFRVSFIESAKDMDID